MKPPSRKHSFDVYMLANYNGVSVSDAAAYAGEMVCRGAWSAVGDKCYVAERTSLGPRNKLRKRVRLEIGPLVDEKIRSFAARRKNKR